MSPVLLAILAYVATFIEGEFSMLALGYAVHQGRLSLTALIVAAALGSFCGDWFFYELGRRKGKLWLQRWPRLYTKTQKVNQAVQRFAFLTIVILRFQIAMRMLGCFTLGSGKLPRNRFLPFNAVACSIWAAFIAWLCLAFAPFWDWFITTMQGIF